MLNLQHLRGVPLLGQPVVDRHPGVLGEGFDICLAVAAELDRVVHAAQHCCGVGNRFLVSQLRAGRVQIGHVSALVVGSNIKRGPGAGGALFEDQRDLLAVETFDLGARVLRQLECLGET